MNDSETYIDPSSIPEYDCLCELCDCGCFEEAKQPHSIECKRFFHQKQPPLNKGDICQSAILTRLPKGQLSEYQYQYLNSKDVYKTFRPKNKDNIDIFTPSGKPNEFNSQSSNFEPQLRSKVLERLSRMMPNNEKISWYKADNNYIGHDDPRNKAVTTLDQYKGDYLKTFDEYNKGFVDSYTEKRGAELVSLSKDESEFSRQLQSSSANFFGKSASMQSFREHDFRSPWIPKKYSGRNMFISHIDSTLFPDKSCKDIEVNTHYNHFHAPNSEQKQSILTEKAPYPKLDKSVRFAMTNDNRYIPSVISLPRKTPLFEETFHEKPKPNYTHEGPVNSTYKGDFETPKGALKKQHKIPLCKAAAIQCLMRRNKMMEAKYNKNKDHTLDSLKKRNKEIDAILMNS